MCLETSNLQDQVGCTALAGIFWEPALGVLSPALPAVHGQDYFQNENNYDTGWDTWADFKRTSSGQVLLWVLFSHETSVTHPSLLLLVWTYPQLCHCLLIQWDGRFWWKAAQQLTVRWEIRWHAYRGEILGHHLGASVQQRACRVWAKAEKKNPSLCSVLSREAECSSSRVKPSKGLSWHWEPVSFEC